MAIKLSNEIKMVVSDFDGVFTDGSVYISEKNEVDRKRCASQKWRYPPGKCKYCGNYRGKLP